MLNALASMEPGKTEELKRAAAEKAFSRGIYAPDSVDDFIEGESFIDIDFVLNDIEDADIDNEQHMVFQYDAAEVIEAAAVNDQAKARKIARDFTDNLKSACSGNEAAVPGWESHANEPAEVLTALYDILDKKFNLKSYSVDYTAWHMDKYTVDIEARSEEEAKEMFFRDHAHEEYDMKDFEITQIKES